MTRDNYPKAETDEAVTHGTGGQLFDKNSVEANIAEASDGNSVDQNDEDAGSGEVPGVGPEIADEVDPATVREQEKERAIDEAQNSLPSGFKLRAEGLYAVWTQNMLTAQRKVSDAIVIVAETQDAEKNNRYIEVEFWLDDVSSRKLRLRREKVAMGDSDVLRQLADAGFRFEMSPYARNKLLEFLHEVIPPHSIVDYYKIGWQADKTFCLPDHSSYHHNHQFSFQGSAKAKLGFSSAGTLEAWSRDVAALAVGNPLLMFALCVAFSGPLLREYGTDTPIFHFFGPTSTGKSTLAAIAASVWGDPFTRHGPKKTWLTTGNALESLVGEHSDTLLVLDEAGVADPAVVVSSAFRVSGGVGKHRLGQDGAARDVADALAAVISTGEKSFLEIAREAKKTVVAGMLVRFIDINADAGDGLGVFNSLHGATDGGALVNKLNAAARSNFGVAGRHFVDSITLGKARSDVIIGEARAEFRRALATETLENTERRVASHFELVFIAGSLAAQCNIVPLTKEQVLESVLSVFKSWRSSVQHPGSLEGVTAGGITKRDAVTAARIDGLLSRIRELVPQYLPEAKVLREGGMLGQPVHGWIERDKEPGVYVKQAYVASVLEGASAPKVVLDWLVQDKLLMLGRKGELAVMRRQPFGKPARVFRFSLSLLEETGDVAGASMAETSDGIVAIKDPRGEGGT